VAELGAVGTAEEQKSGIKEERQTIIAVDCIRHRTLEDRKYGR
jgi:hypothetical protein